MHDRVIISSWIPVFVAGFSAIAAGAAWANVIAAGKREKRARIPTVTAHYLVRKSSADSLLVTNVSSATAIAVMYLIREQLFREG